MCTKLKYIEKSILETKTTINENFTDAYKKYQIKDNADMAAEAGNTKLLRNKLDIPECERRFILERRDSWLPKTIWNLLIPIIVSVISSIVTIYITKQ